MPLVEINNLNYKSEDGTLILENITFSMEAGDFISIVGPNGSGKTTLFKLLLGVKKNYTGSINFFQKEELHPNIKKFHLQKSKQINSVIGYVPQAKTLDKKFPAIALELVVTGITGTWSFFVSKKNKQLALETLDLVGATNLSNRQVSELSGGELQRIYLARAIIRRPKLLLLDEPATGIDFICEKDISKIITELNKIYNTTIMMISHDLTAAYTHSNKVLLLNKHIVYYGSPSAAFTDENILKTFSSPAHKHNVKFGIKDCDCS